MFASGANAAAQALITGFAGGIPELDVEGLEATISVFLITAPLAIAATIVMFGLVRVQFTPDNQMLKTIAFVGGAMVVGLVVGSLIYQTIFDAQLVVNVADLNSAVAHTNGPPWIKLAAAIIW